MIINKIENNNSYLIKLLGVVIDIYDRDYLEEITKNIITKINKKNKLRNLIILEFYIDKKYGTIIILKDYNKLIDVNNEKEVKITVHTDTPFLYKIDYFDIKKNNFDNLNIYYYKRNFYLEIKNDIPLPEYLEILENSEIIYEDSYSIINNGIKI
ncbi:MAG: hypothetical protein IJZ46_03665 [Bacilli bacterium]|nr:hypothetical protein [Bacilli bacterium]